MNEPRPTSDSDFDAQLSAVLEEMADGLSRQRVIDRLVELGFEEDEADDQEALLREQLHLLQRGTRAIVRDLEKGLGRPQAVVRLQELGVSAEDAGRLVDGHRQRRDTVHAETAEIIAGLNENLSREQGVGRFQEMGLSGPLAALLVAWRCDGTAHWYGERVWMGGLAAVLGIGLTAALAALGMPVSGTYLVPFCMSLFGSAFAVHSWVKQRRLLRGALPDGLFALAARGLGRRRVIAEAVARGVPADNAELLIATTFRGTVRIYGGFVLLGLLCVGLGVYNASWCLGQEAPFLLLGAGSLGQILWGASSCVRGLLGWRRFSRP